MQKVMRKIKWITGLLIMLTFGLYGQDQTKSGRQAKQQAATTVEKRGGSQNDADSQQSSADTPGASDAATQANSNNEGAGQATANDQKANTPAITQTTTSSSGSPAVLSGKNGSNRDGTNNVQRASMNMAGSPANNLQLDEIGSEDANAEMEARQNVSRRKEASAANARNGEYRE
jgi:hypothetical protein